MTNITWHGWPQFAAQMLKIPQKYCTKFEAIFFPCDGFCNCEKLICNISWIVSSQKVSNLTKLQTKYPDALDEFLINHLQYLSSVQVFKCVWCFSAYQCKAKVQTSSQSSCLEGRHIFLKPQNCQILQFTGRAN